MCCWLLPVKLFAQQPDITGMWYGQLELTDTAGNPVKLPYEIAISEEKGKLIGYSRIVFHANGKDEAGVQDISVKRKGDEVIMEDEGFIDHGFTINPTRRVRKTVVVKLTLTDKEMILEGTWSTNKTRTYIAYKGSVLLKRKNDFKKSELFKSLDTLKLVAKLSFKDRPETAPDVAVVNAPANNNPTPVAIPQPVAIPEPDPDLVIPSMAKNTAELLAFSKKAQPSTAKILPPSKQKKMQLDALAKSTMKPVVKPAPVVPKPAPAPVVAAVTPKPEKSEPEAPAPKSEPVTVKPAPEKKPEPVVVKSQPKPLPPAAPVIAPSLTQGAAEIDKRVTKSDQSFYFESDSLMLTLYDNGEVDGDTVTVLMNGNIIYSKAGLSTKANNKTVYITPNMDSVKLVMYAESLGEIPPNTGLLIVNDGDKRYEIRFSADLKTNAAIVLRRKKNE